MRSVDALGSRGTVSLLVVLAVLIPILGLPLHSTFQALGGAPGVNVVWVVSSNPSGGDDSAQASCVLGDLLLVFGFDSQPGDYQFRVESRSPSTGALVGVWTRNPGSGNDTLVDCTVMAGYAYATGATITIPPKAYVLKVDSSLNVEVKDLGWIGLSSTIESSGGYLYVGGGDLRGLNLVFRIDKLDGSLARVSSYKSKGLSGHHTVVAGIAFNKVTGHLWAVGVARNDTGDRWWIEIVDPQSMAPVKSIDPRVPGAAITALADNEGFVYVVGDRGHVVKFKPDDSIALNVELKEFTPMKGALIGGYLVIAGHEMSGGYYRHTVYLLDKDLGVRGKSYISENVNADSYLTPGRMWVEDSRLYIAGIDREPGNYRWTIYALELVGVTQTTTTVTVTTTVTTTITQPTTTTYTTTTTTTRITTTTDTKTTTVTETQTTTQTQTTTTTAISTTTVTQPTTTTTTVTQQQTITLTTQTTLTTTTTRVREETRTTTETTTITTTVKEHITQTREVTRTLTELLEREITREVAREHTVTITSTTTQINLPISILLLIIGLAVGGIIARLILSR
ncbi:MAG: hypothetical protein ACO2OZ_05620 [Acidilobaceae archaeon]